MFCREKRRLLVSQIQDIFDYLCLDGKLTFDRIEEGFFECVTPYSLPSIAIAEFKPLQSRTENRFVHAVLGNARQPAMLRSSISYHRGRGVEVERTRRLYGRYRSETLVTLRVCHG